MKKLKYYLTRSYIVWLIAIPIFLVPAYSITIVIGVISGFVEAAKSWWSEVYDAFCSIDISKIAFRKADFDDLKNKCDKMKITGE